MYDGVHPAERFFRGIEGSSHRGFAGNAAARGDGPAARTPGQGPQAGGRGAGRGGCGGRRPAVRTGPVSVTFDKVAALAGSSKTTLYTWWPSAGALAAEACFNRVGHMPGFPDTGGIEVDLRTRRRSFVQLLTAGVRAPSSPI